MAGLCRRLGCLRACLGSCLHCLILPQVIYLVLHITALLGHRCSSDLLVCPSRNTRGSYYPNFCEPKHTSLS